MNILLTCAGRRNYLIGYFREAMGGQGNVFAADCSPIASALQEADKSFIVPTVYDANYVDQLLSICQKYCVRLLIPLNDLELPILAKNRHLFCQVGTIPLVSSSEVIELCFDKWQTFLFAQNQEIAVPRTFLRFEDACNALNSGQISFPLVVKPRWGTASIGIQVCDDKSELELAYALTKKKLPSTLLSRVIANDIEKSVLIQEMLHGKEYGLDVVNNLNGHYECTFVKEKIAMRSGETDKATSIKNDCLAVMGAKIGKCIGHVGNLDCDVFVNEAGCYLLEMNPRFGGGYPFSHMAGANLPAAILAWVDGTEPDRTWLEILPGVTSAKCDRLVLIKD